MARKQSRRGWIGALGLAVGVAQAGVWALRPRGAPPRPEPVAAEDYFTPAELTRARAYQRGQLALAAGGGLVRAGLLGLLVGHRARRDRPGGGGAGSLAGEVAAGGGLAVGLTLVALPFDALRRKRALDVGLATQSWRGWAGDLAKGLVIGGVLAGAGGPIVLGSMRRRGDRWWVEAAAGSVAVGAVFTMAAPVVLDPIFNRFTRLEPGRTRDDVLELARAAGVGVQDVYKVDASRRTTAANAYVTGLGATRRVVLFDTLVETFSREETRLVVAHELAHVRHRDVPRGLVQMGLVAPATMFAGARLASRLDRRTDSVPGSLAAVGLALGIAGGAVGIVSNQLSRAVERRADRFALGLTGSPEAFTSFEQRIVLANLIDPDPPGWFNVLVATHPPAVERIAIAQAGVGGRGEKSLLGA